MQCATFRGWRGVSRRRRKLRKLRAARSDGHAAATRQTADGRRQYWHRLDFPPTSTGHSVTSSLNAYVVRPSVGGAPPRGLSRQSGIPVCAQRTTSALWHTPTSCCLTHSDEKNVDLGRRSTDLVNDQKMLDNKDLKMPNHTFWCLFGTEMSSLYLYTCIM